MQEQQTHAVLLALLERLAAAGARRREHRSRLRARGVRPDLAARHRTRMEPAPCRLFALPTRYHAPEVLCSVRLEPRPLATPASESSDHDPTTLAVGSVQRALSCAVQPQT